VASAFLTFGCEQETPAGDLRSADDLPPIARLTVSPLSGPAPLVAVLDASTSTDDLTAALEMRWDINGDGAFETDFDPGAALLTNLYADPGSYLVTVEVRDEVGHVAIAVAPAPIVVGPPTSPYADIDVDSDRNGVIDANDDPGEEIWGAARGAVFVANWDDDDADGRRDADDTRVNGTSDLVDMTPLVIRRIVGLTSTHTVSLTVFPATAQRAVRIFAADGAGVTQLYAPNNGSVTLTNSTLAAGDLKLWLEGIDGRNSSWDGSLTVTLRIEAGTTVVSEDRVALAVSPVIFPDNAQSVEALYVVRIASGESVTLPLYDALVANLPESVTLTTIDGADYAWDRWVQDSMQTGYQEMVDATGRRTLDTYLQTERARGGLEYLIQDALLGPELGYAYPCLLAACAASSLNYGGNIEVAPPHTVGPSSYPLGRLVIGGGELGTLYGHASAHAHMTAPQREWLDAQAVQGPTIEASTEWLAVGHVDEYFLFVPDHSIGASRPWKVVLASPALARASLQAVALDGGGATSVFQGRSVETTVDAILAATELMTFNDLAQARIDTVRDELKTVLGLDDSDFLEVPVLYEPYVDYSVPTELAVAYNPGGTNLVPVNDLLFIPDPEGPQFGGADPWKTATDQALAPLASTIIYVDVFDGYHLLRGEAHCGTNMKMTPYATSWWQL
jgi:protein-arginine deiminase